MILIGQIPRTSPRAGVAAPKYPEMATVLLCTAVRCCVLCAAVRCCALCAAVRCALLCTAVRCCVLCAVRCSALVRCCVLLRAAVRCARHCVGNPVAGTRKKMKIRAIQGSYLPTA